MKVIENRQEVVKRIKNCRDNKMTIKAIAEKYNVSTAFVQQAINDTLPEVSKVVEVDSLRTKVQKMRKQGVSQKDIADILEISQSRVAYLIYGSYAKSAKSSKATSVVKKAVKSVKTTDKSVAMTKKQVVAMAEALLTLAKSL